MSDSPSNFINLLADFTWRALPTTTGIGGPIGGTIVITIALIRTIIFFKGGIVENDYKLSKTFKHMKEMGN